jgi:UDP-N-acetylglucosamine 4,6-dehydratase/5-epimerase
MFRKMIADGETILPLTDIRMSRFWFTVDKAIDLIMLALDKGKSQDIFIPKLKSFRICDLITAMGCNYKYIGNRGSEKNSELMINEYENYKDYGKYYVLNPNYKDVGLIYDCGINDFMTVEEIEKELKNIY